MADPEAAILEALEFALEWGDIALTERLRAILAGAYDPAADDFYRRICGVTSLSGPNGEPLACGFPRDHDGSHAWSALPTWTPSAAERRTDREGA